MKRTIVFIINPKAGLGRFKSVKNIVKKFLDKDLFEYSLFYTEYPGHAARLAHTAVQSQVDIVVVAGGDGSINEVASEIYGTNIILGIIPIGSGNGLARQLNIPLRVNKAVKLLNEISVTRIDMAFINEIPFVSIAGVGFDGEVAKSYLCAAKSGFKSYFQTISLMFGAYKPKKYTLWIDEKKHLLKALMITFTSANRLGYDSCLSSKTSAEDGLINISIVEKPPLLKAPIVAHLLYFKRFEKSQYVKTYRAKEAVIRKKRKVPVNIDGEPLETDSKNLYIRAEKEALRIIVPK